MAKARRRATQRREPKTSKSVPPDLREFESVDLPEELPPEEVETEEFEELDLESLSAGLGAPTGDLIAAKERLEQRLLLGVSQQAFAAESGTESHGFENIVGVGISEKVAGETFTNDLCVTVYVVAKAPPDEVAAEALIPREIDGVPTDVVATGELLAQPFRGRYRPIRGGVSIGHYRVTAGTLGCFVRRGPALFILSNNHVLANSNSAKLGDPILQPGTADGGRLPADVVGILRQFVPIKFGGPSNLVDCAIAQTNPGLVRLGNIAYGTVSTLPAPCRINLPVKKAGRTTQFTRGRIVDCNATVRVSFGTAGTALFQNQIIIRSVTSAPFSAPGDSGSLIVTEFGNRPTGLLFAGSSSHTIANPISAVLNALNVTIVG